MSKVQETVSIQIGQQMYDTFSSLPNTLAHALADFVDNAVQSYLDTRDQICKFDPSYRLRIDIDVHWDKFNKAQTITVRDNAGGIDYEHYQTAFMPAIRPERNEGLHEFGMGLKTAALWLGNTYSVTTKSYKETTERKITFNLKQVIDDNLLSLPIHTTIIEDSTHYTEIHITNLTDNAPKHNTMYKCKEELASIYRKFLRNNEIEIYVNGDKVQYIEREVLNAPYCKDKDGESIDWKFSGEIKLFQYKAQYTVGLLRTMSSEKYNGIVLMRRGRVIIGAEDHQQYYFKELCGQTGSPLYKRFFAEIELEGFKVSFNKNSINDKENLDALLHVLAQELKNKNYDILYQGANYRDNEAQKSANRLLNSHKQNKPKPIIYLPQEVEIHKEENKKNADVQSVEKSVSNETYGKYNDPYMINGICYDLEVELVNDTSNHDAFWTDTAQVKENNVIKCKINMGHAFFQHFKKPKEDVIALFKALTMAKFTAKKEKDSTEIVDVLEYFNHYLEKIKV